MESLDQEFATKPAPNGQMAPSLDRRPCVEFGTLPNHSFPHEWAVWIFTGMRNAELAKEKPRPFSAWLSAACLHFAGMDAE